MRPLTFHETQQVRALMRTRVDAEGKTWLIPTSASTKLERELNGSLAEARERTAKLDQRRTALRRDARRCPVEPI